MRDVRDVTIVGGGDAGLLTGLAIQQRNPQIETTIVDDFEENQTDVGKSTFKSIVGILHDFLDIKKNRFLREVKPIFKSTIYFRNWCGYEPFHYPFDLQRIFPDESDPNIAEKYYHIYDEVLTNPSRYKTSNEATVETAKTPYAYTPQGTLDSHEPHAYHLSTSRLNDFLRTLCEERGVSLVDDRITNVRTEKDRITRVDGENNTYESDVYVDASGFNRILKKRVDSSFRDFDMPLDSAFNTQIERELSETIPATVIQTGDHGWFWQIDTFDNRDFGYVFASEYVTDEDALSDFLHYCGVSEAEADVSKYEFTSGFFERAWEGNCIAIGNAEGFVEPLQSTGLTANAQAATVLSILLDAHDRTMHTGIRNTFNGYVRNMWETIYDFIYMHYRYSSGDNDFWQAMQSLEGSTRAQQIIEGYNNNGLITTITPLNTTANPVKHDETILNLTFFPLSSFYAIMRKMGAESAFYETNSIQVSNSVREEVRQFFDSMSGEPELYLTSEEVYNVL